ncbi:MAG: hypothetical protein NVSMB51_05990 [Solirubrobacteraceae bacterium]
MKQRACWTRALVIALHRRASERVFEDSRRRRQRKLDEHRAARGCHRREERLDRRSLRLPFDRQRLRAEKWSLADQAQYRGRASRCCPNGPQAGIGVRSSQCCEHPLLQAGRTADRKPRKRDAPGPRMEMYFERERRLPPHEAAYTTHLMHCMHRAEE